MPKARNILPAFAVVLIFGLSHAAFAQETCSVASTPVSNATQTGLTEPAGDLLFNCTYGGTPTTAATLTINYGVPITNSTAYPPGKPISVTTEAGAPPGIAAVDTSVGQVLVSIPAQTTDLTFTVRGVLLSLSGSGQTSVSATLSVSPGNGVLITAGQTTAVVVRSVVPGIRNPGLTPGTIPGIILASGMLVTTLTSPALIAGGFVVTVPENYIDMYRSQAQFNGSASTQGVRLLFTFTGIPPGVTFSSAAGSTTAPCGAAITSAGAASGSVTFVAGTNRVLTSTMNTFLLEVTAARLSALENISVGCAHAVIDSSATLPLTPGPIRVTVTLAPTGTAFGAAGEVQTMGEIPRYSSNPLPVPPLTVVNILPSSTNLLFPFVSIGNGFDTGFAIGNTTGDPLGGTANGGAQPQSGTITLYFFPTGGTTSFCVTTGGTATNPVAGGSSAVNCSVLSSTSIGLGLGTGGVVGPGASWVVLGSEIFKNVSGTPSIFNGYVFGVANFTNAHGTAFVVDATFSGKFTAGGPALVLPNPVVTGRASALWEILNH